MYSQVCDNREKLAVDCQVKLTPFFNFLHLKLTPLPLKHCILAGYKNCPKNPQDLHLKLTP